MSTLPTKRSSVLGLPIGPKHTDWARVGKIGAVGAAAASAVAGGVGATRLGGRLKERVSEQAQKGKEALEKVGDVAEQASSIGKSVSGPVSKVSSVVGKITGSSKGDGEGGKGSGRDKNLKKLRLIIKESIEVGVPLQTAYNQWTQFTELPTIMKAPQSIDQEEDDVTRWVVKIGPSRRGWTAKILEQVPDERIAWESTDGTENRGVVTFHRLDHNLTRVQVEMEYFPHGFVEKVGNIFLTARRHARKDLRFYKHYLELAGSETGAWRGEIAGDEDDEAEDSESGGDQKAAQQDAEAGEERAEQDDEGGEDQESEDQEHSEREDADEKVRASDEEDQGQKGNGRTKRTRSSKEQDQEPERETAKA